MRPIIRLLVVLLTFAFLWPAQSFAASKERRVSIFGLKIFNRDKVRKKKAIRKKARRKVYRKKTRSSRKSRKASRKAISRSRARVRAKKRRARARQASRRAKLYARTNVRYRSREKPGTIIVDTKTRHLYHIRGNGKATRYGVAVGKSGFAWSGTSRIRRKVKWPTWTPPAEMIQRKPSLAKYKNGQPGGPANPLGAAALYLYQGKKDTLYRIHGTNNPGSIGRAASSGCIRMRNKDIQHLYAQIKKGTKVIVR